VSSLGKKRLEALAIAGYAVGGVQPLRASSSVVSQAASTVQVFASPGFSSQKVIDFSVAGNGRLLSRTVNVDRVVTAFT